MKNLRKQLEAAEARLSDLLNKCDQLHDQNREHFAELARMIEAGEAPEGDLIAAQMQAEQRQMLIQRAALAYEQETVLPLRSRVRELEADEMRGDVRRLDDEAAAARTALSGFLAQSAEHERELRAAVSRAEESSAGLQRKLRNAEAEDQKMNAER